MPKRYFSMAGIAIAILVVLAACGTSQDEGPVPTVTRIASPANFPELTATSEPGAEPTAAPTEASGGETEGTTEAAGDIQEVTVTAHDIYYEPTEVKIKAGKVKFTLPNQGAAVHDFTIDDLGIHVTMAPGTTETLDADIPAGTYQFYCSIPGHKDAGMVGTLVVE